MRVTVSGLRGSGLTLQNSAADDLAISGNGSFEFSTAQAVGSSFAVTVRKGPEMPPQTCSVVSGSGRIGSLPTTVAVTCAAPPHFAVVTALSSTTTYSIDSASGGLTATGSSVPTGGIKASAIAPSGRYIYQSDIVGNAVRAFSIDIDTGNLSELPGSPMPTGASQPQMLALAKNGKFLYVANRGSNSLSVFAVDTTTGRLTLSGPPVATGTFPLEMVLSRDDQTLFVANYVAGSVSSYAVDAATGALTFLQETPTAPNTRYLALDATGRFLFATTGGNGVYAFTIDPVTRALGAVPGSPFVAGTGAQNLVTTTQGALYVTNETSATVSSFTIDATTGALSTLGPALPTGGLPEGLAIDPITRRLYVASQSTRAMWAYSIDATTGALIAEAVLPVPQTPIDIAFVGFP